MKNTSLIALVLCLLSGSVAFAQDTDLTEAFRSMMRVSPAGIRVPTVVELPLGTGMTERNEYGVYETTSGSFVPYYLKQTFTAYPTPLSAYAEDAQRGIHSADALMDNDPDTYEEYQVPGDRMSTVRISLTASETIESSSLILELAEHVALPVSVAIWVTDEQGRERIVVARRTMQSSVVAFPVTRSKEWYIEFSYVQPLRVSELRLIEDRVERTMERSIRFLAQPNASYIIYHDADRTVDIDTLERGNLADDEGVRNLAAVSSMPNPAYQEADSDGDGVSDIYDNCVQTVNDDQIDIDANGRGDACDDFDRDGTAQLNDNCPSLTNASQEDTDGDGIGDACDDEESRFTEKYAWVPWAGMGIAALVLIVLFILVWNAPRRDETL